MLRNYCQKCHKFYDDKFIKNSNGIPRCSCGGIVKPDVVLYEESLDNKVIEGALSAIEEADLLIIGGTSLVVQPAASLIYYYRGKDVVLINKSETPADSKATLVFHDSLGSVFGALKI